MQKSHTISIFIDRKPDQVFDLLLDWPSRISENAKKQDDGWWSFETTRGPAKLRFKENKEFGILDHQFVDEEATWDVPMRVVPNDQGSELMITLFQSPSFSDELFSQRMDEMQQVMEAIKATMEKI